MKKLNYYNASSVSGIIDGGDTGMSSPINGGNSGSGSGIGGGGFAFGTLWQEATKAIGYFADAIVSLAGLRVQESKLKDDARNKGNKQNIQGSGNQTAYIIFAVVMLGIFALYFFKQKKQ